MSSVIIVLGSPNDDQGNLSDIALSRCQAALSVFKKNPHSRLLLTGGFGEHFNRSDTPHARHCQCYLMQQGVPESAFTDIVLSRFTFEDGTLSVPIIEQHRFSEIWLVTSEFHMPRAKLIFSQLLPELSFHYIEAKTAISEAKLQQLIRHELSVMGRERTNLAKLLSMNQ
ncbi:YdcF family protein [Shewanella sp. Isolate13]|uniref:YdcF family protein n=1 Tax=Shewanella sp. Isolate13 TaxID=2908531 RepID=UPI001EFE3048|nr:YdcF family protein [Shewanella sp. Isolate13]MCG9731182.1 YdcF family protein [Shewanella sp. Isolate13]